MRLFQKPILLLFIFGNRPSPFSENGAKSRREIPQKSTFAAFASLDPIAYKNDHERKHELMKQINFNPFLFFVSENYFK